MPTSDAPAPPPGEVEKLAADIVALFGSVYYGKTGERQQARVCALLSSRGLTVARDAPDVGLIPASSYDDAVRAVGQLELNVRYWRERAERAEAGREVSSEVARDLATALAGLMDAVGDMPADPSECWPGEWNAATVALDDYRASQQAEKGGA